MIMIIRKMKKKKKELKDKKAMDEMNIPNKTFSLLLFMDVMKMCGRVIINLGFIYFIQFICVNSVIIRNSNKRDIPFLPISKSDDKLIRKGKFEFVNIFYQIGIFTSKHLLN